MVALNIKYFIQKQQASTWRERQRISKVLMIHPLGTMNQSATQRAVQYIYYSVKINVSQKGSEISFLIQAWQ